MKKIFVFNAIGLFTLSEEGNIHLFPDSKTSTNAFCFKVAASIYF